MSFEMDDDFVDSLEKNRQLEIDSDILDDWLSSAGTLSPGSKALLSIPPEAREEEDLTVLIADLEGIDFFKKFTNEIREELARRISLATFDHNQFVLRQNTSPVGMYILTSGVVSLRYNLTSSASEEEYETSSSMQKPTAPELESSADDAAEFPSSEVPNENGSDQPVSEPVTQESATGTDSALEDTGEKSVASNKSDSDASSDANQKKSNSESDSSGQTSQSGNSSAGHDQSDSSTDGESSDHGDTKPDTKDANTGTDSPPPTNVEESKREILTDPEQIARRQWPEKILSRGSFFGHEDLIQDRPSTVDAIAVGYSELILLDKEDFDIVIVVLGEDEAHKQELMRGVDQILSKFSWSEEERRVLETFSEVRFYDEEVEIYRGELSPKFSRFVVSGEFKLVRDLEIVDKSKPRSLRQDEESQAKTVAFETVKQGFFFGVGESFGRTRVLSTPASEILMVPRLVLLNKNKALLEEMVLDLEVSLPFDEVVADDFNDYERARKGIDQLCTDMQSQSRRSETETQKPAFIKY